jgi:hypothetical protein
MYNYKINIVLYVILAIIGASFIFIPTESLLNFIFSTLGIMIVLFNIVPCVTYINAALQNKQYIVPAISYFLIVLFGLMFIFGWSNMIISIIFGISLIVLPVIRVIQSKTINGLKKELPYILVGIVSFFIPFTNIIGIILKIFGGLIILYSIYMIVMTIINKNKNNNNFNGNNNNDKNNIVIDAEIREL